MAKTRPLWAGLPLIGIAGFSGRPKPERRFAKTKRLI